MADIDKEITVKVRAEDDTAKATQSAKARLKELQAQMLTLEQQGQKNTDAFRRMAAEAGQLKDAIGDTSAQVKALASDTRTLDTFTSAIQGIAGGFAVAQGAAALFGEENEDVQKAMMKVQAALALVNGATALANTLNKDSALMVNLNAAAQRAYALAVGTSTGALKALRIALVTTGLGALVVAVGFAINAIMEYTSKNKEAEESQKDLNQALEDTVGTFEFYERELRAFGATDADLAKIRLKSLEAEQKSVQANLDHAIATEGKKNNAYQKSANERLQFLRVEMKEQQNIIDAANKQAAEAAAAEALRKKQRAEAETERRKREHQRQIDENQVNYMQLIDGFTKYYDKLVEIAGDREAKLIGKKRAGVKDGLQESERLRLREEKIEQARIDTSAKTFQALGNLATLFAGKSEKEQRRAFEINKKMSMAQTLIETYSAAQGAYRSQLSIPSPEAPIRAAIAAAAAVAAGLLRVKQISQQQFQSPSAGGGGTGGGGGNEGGGMAAPQGNALNPNSQLINPNTGQAQMPPLRAYVVESDVSGIQQRLRMIRQFAQLGPQ